jgi:calcineurin-like phosphoesterase family protein
MDYVISDLHLGHVSLHRLYRQQFSGVDEMHEHIVKMWNDKIKNNDVKIYVLGDVGYKESIEAVLPRLRGQKILLLGNHDSYSREFYLKHFSEVHDKPLFWAKRIVFSHHPIPVEPGVINIHGHTHIVDLLSEQHFNVCVERIDYTPREMGEYEKLLSSIQPPNRKFLEEWYKDIMLPTEPRPDIALDASGKIDVEATKSLKAKIRHEREKKSENLGEF